MNNTINLNDEIINFITLKINTQLFNKNEVDKKTTLCFTGHRPKYLPIEEKNKTFIKIKENLYNLIIESINNGYTYFISGLAQGIDMLSAELIINLKQKYPNIILECAIPHLKQSYDYNYTDKKRYLSIIKNADFLTLISKDYHSGCMMKRNRYMVDKSSLLLGVWNGNKSGTLNTINYAKSKDIPCKLILF